jgi:hypothetical protein
MTHDKMHGGTNRSHGADAREKTGIMIANGTVVGLETHLYPLFVLCVYQYKRELKPHRGSSEYATVQGAIS